MIVFRRRQSPVPFCEFLVVPQYDSLHLPKVLPERYFHRVIRTLVLQGTKCYEVESSSFSCNKITYSSIVQGNGVWIVSDDCNSRGGFETVRPLRQFMSVPIDEESAHKILKLADHFPKSPLALYHGTSNDLVQNIVISGIKSSDGMLGNSIYLGTLWKAARFATMTQTYEHRKGSILRVLAFPRSVCIFPRKDWICKCEKCRNDPWASHVADHRGLWKESYDCANAVPSTSMGSCRDGSKRYALRNEEWALSTEVPLVLTHYAKINPETLAGPHHDPLHREIKIS